jgi:hypothetical protein
VITDSERLTDINEEGVQIDNITFELITPFRADFAYTSKTLNLKSNSSQHSITCQGPKKTNMISIRQNNNNEDQIEININLDEHFCLELYRNLYSATKSSPVIMSVDVINKKIVSVVIKNQ